jgi:hypothetical protein
MKKVVDLNGVKFHRTIEREAGEKFEELLNEA